MVEFFLLADEFPAFLFGEEETIIIAQIQENRAQNVHLQTYSEGSFRTNEIQDPVTPSSINEINPFVSKERKIGIGWQKDGEMPDQIGLTNGEALLEAFAAMSISQECIAKLESIGNEVIIASERLFNAPEQELWILNVVIEDFKKEKFEPIALFIEESINDTDSVIVFEDAIPAKGEMDSTMPPMMEPQKDFMVIAENFEFQDSNDDEVDDELEIEDDYLKAIDRDNNTLANNDEKDLSTMDSEPLGIELDEPMAQEIEFYESEGIYLAVVVDCLWEDSDEASPSCSDVEMTFIDELLK